ncbi:MAG: elongation factor G [Oligosphaeraceae bacterium]|nr:elongation factor G [Oligosphaeraceae bacterium]
MKNCAPEKVRNFVLAGHAGSGKTSLADLMLFKSGAVNRRGSVDNGSSVSDFRPDEQERKSSIYSAALNCPWQDGHFFFMDAPGNSDFCGEAMGAINIADMMVLVVDAMLGIGPGTIRAWRQARERNMPRMIFINGCDRDQANFAALLDELRHNYGSTLCIPYNLPIGSKSAMTGVACVMGEVPGEYAAQAEELKTMLTESIAESDEELMEKYFEAGELSDEEFKTGFRNAVLNGSLVPILVGSADKDLGVSELMDAILAFGPSPLDDVRLRLDAGELDRKSNDALGFVFKSVNDPFMGQMNFIRVLCGTFKSDSELINSTSGGKERVGNLLQIQGKEQSTVESAGPGAIVAVAKLRNTSLNDVLGYQNSNLKFSAIDFPQATTMYAISAANKGEEDKLGTALGRLAGEDPTLLIERNPETRQTVISGMGDLHINLLVNRMKNDFKVEVELEAPRVPYRETVNGVGTAQYRHKKQSGGHGQFAEVHLRIEPFAGDAENEFEFGNEVVGGNIPKNYIPAVEKGVIETRMAGPLSRSKVINFKATVYDGKYHDVDSSEMAFKIATRGAFREAMAKAKPMLLEPIMSLSIMFPEEYMGAISGDLNSRRGRILGMDHEEGMQILRAELPLAECYSYPTQLRSMTQGRGSFEMKFERYETVPAQLAAKIQEEAAKLLEEEED